MTLQRVTHQMHPVKRLADCHTGCGWACVPTTLFDEFKSQAEPRRLEYKEKSVVAVCMMVVCGLCFLDTYLTETSFL